MAKKGKRPAGSEHRKKKRRVWQVLLALIVLGGMVSIYFVTGQESSSETPTTAALQGSPDASSPTLRNRLVLPAWPQKLRPFTLSPDKYTEPETRQAYQAAKDVPEVLENVACYCGCYGTAAHRNNLDCFKDSHGETWSLCRQIALEAQRQNRLGTPIRQIKRMIDERWAPPAPR